METHLQTTESPIHRRDLDMKLYDFLCEKYVVLECSGDVVIDHIQATGGLMPLPFITFGDDVDAIEIYCAEGVSSKIYFEKARQILLANRANHFIFLTPGCFNTRSNEYILREADTYKPWADKSNRPLLTFFCAAKEGSFHHLVEVESAPNAIELGAYHAVGFCFDDSEITGMLPTGTESEEQIEAAKDSTEVFRISRWQYEVRCKAILETKSGVAR